MRCYIMTTGALFGLITLLHIWRMIVEGRKLAADPWYILLTLIAAALAVWAWRLLRLSRPS
ncbi:MAG TPA: hypothetical protein VKM56_12905 [Verrucomicrobiae bacterium]|nr:hypothetical protein [Verrucomicrobiae bacterium]